MVTSAIYNKYIISPFKLNQIINNEQLKVIDCRWYINDKKKGKEEYEKKHNHFLTIDSFL